jgi:hypothetical protein
MVKVAVCIFRHTLSDFHRVLLEANYWLAIGDTIFFSEFAECDHQRTFGDTSECMFPRCVRGWRREIRDFLQWRVGAALFRATLTACTVGVFVLTFTKADAQTPLDSDGAKQALLEADADADAFVAGIMNQLSRFKCIFVINLDEDIQEAKDLQTRLIKLKYEPNLPGEVLPSPTGGAGEYDNRAVIDADVADLDRAMKILRTSERCSPKLPSAPVTPVTPIVPVTPPKAAPVPATPLAATPQITDVDDLFSDELAEASSIAAKLKSVPCLTASENHDIDIRFLVLFKRGSADEKLLGDARSNISDVKYKDAQQRLAKLSKELGAVFGTFLRKKRCSLKPTVPTEFDKKLWQRLKTGHRPELEETQETRIEIGCRDKPISVELCSATGFYVGASIGVRGNKDGVTNENQVTFFGSDLRPDPTASGSNTGIYGNIDVGYNSVVPLGSTMSGLIGGEIFIGAGSNSSTISGIPGTGGIAGPAAMANDSTTVKESWDTGIVVKVGPVVQIGNTPVYFAFDAGVSILQAKLSANCTGAGACGVNGIPAQSLSVSKTLTGGLFGFEAGMPLASAFGTSMPADNATARVLRTANIRVQYLHGDYGHATGVVGNPAQIQLTMDQKVRTNSVTIGLDFPLSRSGQ